MLFNLLQWQFSDNGVPQLTSTARTPHQLVLTQGIDIQATEIEQKDCAEARKTLKVMKAPNGSQAGEIACLTNSTQFSAPPRSQATPSHAPTPSSHTRDCHLTSIGCSLGVTHMKSKQRNKIQGQAVGALLATGGCNQHFPHALVFAPKSHRVGSAWPLSTFSKDSNAILTRSHATHCTTQSSDDKSELTQPAGCN